MNYEVTEQTADEIKIKVIVTAAELQAEAQKTASKLALDLKFDGFRHGKAPYDLIKNKLGEMPIFEEAAADLVTKQLNEILLKEKWDIWLQPEVKLEKISPGNEFIYQAFFKLMPAVQLPNLETIKIIKREPVVEESKINETLEKLREMRVKEYLVNRPAKKGDRADIDFEVFVDGKLIEGGKAKNQQVIIGDGQMIPGFEDNLIDLQAGDEKDFELTFPKNYLEKLAGKPAKFKINVRAVYGRELPALTDDFAQGLGRKDLQDLRNQLSENIKAEAISKEQERQELEILENLITASIFSAIPKKILDDEQENMLEETKKTFERDGGRFEDYLKHLQKTEAELKESFSGEAERRVKLHLIFRKIIHDNKIAADQKKIEETIEAQASAYSYDEKNAEKIRSANYKERLQEFMLNRAVIDWLKEKITIE